MIKILLITTLFISCSKTFKLKKKNNLHFFKELEFEIDNVKEIPWKVGRKKDKEISMGFSYETNIPLISQTDAHYLQEKYNVDSWLFKIEKEQKGKKKTIGYIEYKFKSYLSGTNVFNTKILYHSAIVSDQFRRFHCPAFNHRFKINDVDIEDSTIRYNNNIYVSYEGKKVVRTTKPSFSTISFSADRNLKAKFFVSIALFNSQDKKIFSKFIEAKNYIDVKKQTKITLPSCIGIKEEVSPLPESRPPNFKDLEIR
ncbi:MAG: hypothetical protein N4A33_13440 [Bacteriovoracaceae bacterium]|jgi:hypothetical protein|nr:hypothetical protein [Bacteriovoracaceae bacterium]